jgi:hypothetical protein
MIDDLDIFRAAKLLVDHHGTLARAHATERAAELQAGGDAVGHAVWLRIAAAVDDLLVVEAGGPLN